MLRPNTLTPAPGATHRPKRVGRGNASGHGTSSTRGGKGQTARSGGSRGIALRAFKAQLQSTPKLRGFKSPRVRFSEVYLSDLEKSFESGAEVTVAVLKDKGLIGASAKTAKVIGTGTLTKKLTLKGVAATKAVREKITALGGSVA